MPRPIERSLPRLFASCAWVIFAGCLGAASANPPVPDARIHHERPSKFDYLVLASMADSPRLMAMVGYRAAAQRAATTPVGKTTPPVADDR
jgi:hypothetical protein